MSGTTVLDRTRAVIEAVEPHLDPVMGLLNTLGAHAGAALWALGIFVGGWIVARWASGVVAKWLGRAGRRIEPTLRPFLASLVRNVILLVAAVAALAELGVPVGSVVAVLGAAGLAIGLALQGTLANIAAGVMLLILRPLRAGDFIETPDVTGTVRSIQLFSTELETVDGLYLWVPNAQLFSNRIQNFDRFSTRRVNVRVGVAYDTDLRRARDVIRLAMIGLDFVKEEPAPVVYVESFDDSAITLHARCWCPSVEALDHASEVRIAIKEALDAAGVQIPYPQRVVHMVKPLAD